MVGEEVKQAPRVGTQMAQIRHRRCGVPRLGGRESRCSGAGAMEVGGRCRRQILQLLLLFATFYVTLYGDDKEVFEWAIAVIAARDKNASYPSYHCQ